MSATAFMPHFSSQPNALGNGVTWAWTGHWAEPPAVSSLVDRPVAFEPTCSLPETVERPDSIGHFRHSRAEAFGKTWGVVGGLGAVVDMGALFQLGEGQ